MVVVAAVIAREGRVLVCQRGRKGAFPLKWEFPGGKVLAGEAPEVALKRELREELGVDATVGAELYRKRHKYDSLAKALDLIFFSTNIGGGEVENRVFEKIEWAAPERLSQLDFLDADRELIEKLANRELLVR